MLADRPDDEGLLTARECEKYKETQIRNRGLAVFQYGESLGMPKFAVCSRRKGREAAPDRPRGAGVVAPLPTTRVL